MQMLPKREVSMRQMKLELGLDETEQAQKMDTKIDRKTQDEVVVLVAEAIIAAIDNAREKEADGEPLIQP